MAKRDKNPATGDPTAGNAGGGASAGDSPSDKHELLHFALQVDDGWPPIATESAWAERLEGNHLKVSNVPFFAVGVSCGDVVEAERNADGGWQFARVATPGGHSTVRLLVPDKDGLQDIVDELVDLGCAFEGTYIEQMVAVDVPPGVDYGEVRRWLDTQEDSGALEYEEGNLSPAHAEAGRVKTLH